MGTGNHSGPGRGFRGLGERQVRRRRIRQYQLQGSYDTSGGLSSEGEIGYENLAPQARHVWFDFFTTSDDEHRVIRVTVDLATGAAQTQK